LKEVMDIVRKARASSAPGPNGIPYRVYKNCLKLTRRLWKLLRVAWRRGKLAESWQRAEGCFIPKEENAESLGQFRTILLLNVEVLARRMTDYMLSNEYVDIAVKKGGILQLTLKSLTEEFKVTKVRQIILLRYSRRQNQG